MSWWFCLIPSESGISHFSFGKVKQLGKPIHSKTPSAWGLNNRTILKQTPIPQILPLRLQLTTTASPRSSPCAFSLLQRLGKNRWKICTPPPLLPYDGKLALFGFCAVSSLNWGMGVVVLFYSVQDCNLGQNTDDKIDGKFGPP